MEVGGGILLITTMTLVMLGLVISYVCRWGNNLMGDSKHCFIQGLQEQERQVFLSL